MNDLIEFAGTSWRVLEKQGDKTLLLSDAVLCARMYHSTDEGVTWEHCDLRKYLNGEFYENTFSEEEKNRIVETKLLNADNPKYGTAGGNDTADKVFLLSLDETERYLVDDLARTAVTVNGEASHWWLRSPGCEDACAAYVEYDGAVSYGFGHWSGVTSIGGVRPAMWVRLN